MSGNASLRERLAHVRWLGGGSGGGKSTIAAALEERHGLRVYSTDAAIQPHVARSRPDEHPLLHAFLNMTMDERWLDRSPEVMLETFHGFQGEGFELIVEDLLAMPPDQPVLAEGFRLVPRFVAPLLSHPDQATWLLPTPAFREAAHASRGSTWHIAGRTSNPTRALENLLRRDALFTDLVREEAQALGLSTIEVDLGTDVETLLGRVRDALSLTGTTASAG